MTAKLITQKPPRTKMLILKSNIIIDPHIKLIQLVPYILSLPTWQTDLSIRRHIIKLKRRATQMLLRQSPFLSRVSPVLALDHSSTMTTTTSSSQPTATPHSLTDVSETRTPISQIAKEQSYCYTKIHPQNYLDTLIIKYYPCVVGWYQEIHASLDLRINKLVKEIPPLLAGKLNS